LEVSNIYKLFIAEVKKQLYIRGWKYADLSKATGYTVGTIEAFMCGARESERMANCIAQVLGIER
jgi:lambda repressor-like predicted transcriptional regulator